VTGLNLILNPYLQGGYRVQAIGFTVELKNLSFTHRLSEYFLNRCGTKSLCSVPSWRYGFRLMAVVLLHMSRRLKCMDAFHNEPGTGSIRLTEFNYMS